MSCPCCSGVGEIFDERQAQRDARRYRRKGLDRAGRRIVALLGSSVRGAEVLEVGGGIGSIELELLRAGAERTTDVELSPGYEQVAAELVREAGVEDRVTRVVGDLVAEPSLAGEADVAVLNRVVCCTPEPAALVGAAAARARRRLVLSFPPDHLPARLVVGAGNLFLRLRGNAFRAYAHPHAVILGPALARGFRIETSTRAGVWRVVALTR